MLTVKDFPTFCQPLKVSGWYEVNRVPRRCYVKESQAKLKSYKPCKLIRASIGPQIQAGETKAEKHKEVTMVQMEEKYNGVTYA